MTDRGHGGRAGFEGNIARLKSSVCQLTSTMKTILVFFVWWHSVRPVLAVGVAGARAGAVGVADRVAVSRGRTGGESDLGAGGRDLAAAGAVGGLAARGKLA